MTTNESFEERHPHEIHASLDDYDVVDVREPFERHGPLGHVEGSERIDRGELHNHTERLGQRPVLLVCRSGRRSADACRILVENGVTDVVNLAGGMIAWLEAGLPVAREPATTAGDLAATLGRWSAMLTMTPLEEIVKRWPALGETEPSLDALSTALDEIEKHLADGGAPPDLDRSMAVFREDLASLASTGR